MAAPSWLFGSGGGGWLGGVELCRQLRCGLEFGGFRVDGFVDFYRDDVAGAEHVGGEDDELFVGREADVGLEAVVVVGHVDEVFGVEDAGLPEVGIVERAFA